MSDDHKKPAARKVLNPYKKQQKPPATPSLLPPPPPPVTQEPASASLPPPRTPPPILRKSKEGTKKEGVSFADEDVVSRDEEVEAEQDRFVSLSENLLEDTEQFVSEPRGFEKVAKRRNPITKRAPKSPKKEIKRRKQGTRVKAAQQARRIRPCDATMKVACPYCNRESNVSMNVSLKIEFEGIAERGEQAQAQAREEEEEVVYV
jgi:hypothetical protein